MDYRPIAAYLIFLVLYRISESIVMIRIGYWKKRPKWEWTLPLVVLSFVLILIGPVLEYIYYGAGPRYISYIIGGSLFLLATLFRVKGHLDLKKGFSMSVERVEGQQLVETGLYRHIRHPLYLGTVCLFIACPTFLCAKFCLGLSLLGLVVIYFRIRKEEEFLVKHMQGYKEYMYRTWALIPRVY